MSSSKRALLLLERCKGMKQLKQIHAHMLAQGLGDDSFVVSRLMAFCSDRNRGSLSHSHLLFQTAMKPTLCIRNTMIKAWLLRGEHIQPMQMYHRILLDGLSPDCYTLPYVLKACAGLRDLRAGKLVHTHVLRLGFRSDTFVGNTLIFMYMDCGDAEAAAKVFDEIPHRNAASWTVVISGFSKLGEVEVARVLFDEAPTKDLGIWGSMVSGYVQNNCYKEGLLMFRLMQVAGLEPDEGVLVNALCACAQLGAMDLGTWIHHYLYRVGFPLSFRLGTALIDMYVKCGNLGFGRKVFDSMPHRDTICWNVMIFGLAMHGDGKGALELFSRMRKDGCQPDDVTYIGLLTACGHSGMVEEGRRLFDKMGTEFCIELKSEHYGCLVDSMARAGLFHEAKEIIDGMPTSSTVAEKAIAWRALLSACWNHGETSVAEVAAEHLLQLEVHSGVYILLSNIYEDSGKHSDAGTIRKSMRDRGVPKAPGCSSIEIGGCVCEFVAGELIHPQLEEIYQLLETLNGQIPSVY